MIPALSNLNKSSNIRYAFLRNLSRIVSSIGETGVSKGSKFTPPQFLIINLLRYSSSLGVKLLGMIK